MITLEQVRLLETRITKTIEYVKKVTGENTALKGKLDSYQKRIAELEVLIQRFREDQSRIEDTILSALDRLNQFEDAVEGAPQMESKNKEAKQQGSGASSTPEIPEDPEKNSDNGELDIF